MTKRLVRLVQDYKSIGILRVLVTDRKVNPSKIFTPQVMRIDPDAFTYEGEDYLRNSPRGSNAYIIGDGRTVGNDKNRNVTLNDKTSREWTDRDYAVVFFQIPEEEVDLAYRVSDKKDQEFKPL